MYFKSVFLDKKKRTIEFFGVPGCGKSHLRKSLKKKLYEKKYQVYDSRELIILFLNKFIKISLTNKINFLFFRALLVFKVKTTLWNKNLNIACDEFLKKEKNKFFNYEKIIKYFKKGNNKSDLMFKMWVKELTVASIIFQKIRAKNLNIIFVPDEGFIQKLFFFTRLKNKNYEKLIKNFLKLKIFSEKVIFVKSNKENLNFVHNVRKKNNYKGRCMDNNEINLSLQVVKKIRKHTKFKYDIINNNFLKKGIYD